MADGFSAYCADIFLEWLGGTAPSTPPSVYAQLHTGPPGAAGTANVSSVTSRRAVSFAAPSGGVLTASGSPVAAWLSWAGTNNEVVTDISLWDASSGGNFLDSVELTGTWYAFTCPSASPGLFTAPGAGLGVNGTVVYLAPAVGSTLPGGFSAGTPYYVVNAAGSTFQLSATSGGSGINATSGGAGLIAAAQPSNPIATGDTLQLASLTIALPVAA
jgi:hypothetical protein